MNNELLLNGDMSRGNLRVKVQVLQARRFAKVQTVRDVFGEHERGTQVIDVPGLSRVRSECDGVQPFADAQSVQRVQIGVDVVGIVRVLSLIHI